MKNISYNCQLLVLVLLATSQLTSGFQIQSALHRQVGAVNSINAQYKVIIDDKLNMKILRQSPQRVQIKASANIPCYPLQVSMKQEGMGKNSLQLALSYLISVVCNNKSQVNFRYYPVTGNLEQIQKQTKQEQEGSQGPARLLQNGTNDTAVCGNSVVETGEQCDDGNKVALDGCSVTCTYQCGDGTLNSNLEQCDDGNRVDGDGCSSLCVKQDSAVALPLALGISLGSLGIIGLIIGKIVLAKSAMATGSAAAAAQAGQIGQNQRLPIDESTKVLHPNGYMY